MKQKTFQIFFFFLLIFISKDVFADIIIPAKNSIYIESFGEKINIPMNIVYYYVGYTSTPWEDKIVNPKNERINFWEFSYKKYGDLTYAYPSGNYIISVETRVSGKINEDVYFDQKVEGDFRTCNPMGQFSMATSDKDGEKFYVFDDTEGYSNCMEKSLLDTDITACEEKYRREVAPSTFERDIEGNILDSDCIVKLDILPASWNNKKKAQEFLKQNRVNIAPISETKVSFFQKIIAWLKAFFE